MAAVQSQDRKPGAFGAERLSCEEPWPLTGGACKSAPALTARQQQAKVVAIEEQSTGEAGTCQRTEGCLGGAVLLFVCCRCSSSVLVPLIAIFNPNFACSALHCAVLLRAASSAKSAKRLCIVKVQRLAGQVSMRYQAQAWADTARAAT